MRLWCSRCRRRAGCRKTRKPSSRAPGLTLIKPRGARDYRGAVAGLDGVEVAYLSASEITGQLAPGAVHLGVTGEDLVREMIPDADAKVVLIEGLGFGYANVVVAVPQAWIDVRTMADLDDVATSFRHTHDRKMRVATKYVNLTRDFFSAHGIIDYRIVESSGATEGAPAAGTAELIVDITTTGATLAANALKVVDDGVILRSQANLVAARTAAWGEHERELARVILDRIAAQAARPRLPRGARALCRLRRQLVDSAKEKFGVATPFGGPTSSGMLTLHCPPGRGLCAHQLPARARRRSGGGGRSRLRVLARQSALRQAGSGLVSVNAARKPREPAQNVQPVVWPGMIEPITAPISAAVRRGARNSRIARRPAAERPSTCSLHGSASSKLFTAGTATISFASAPPQW